VRPQSGPRHNFDFTAKNPAAIRHIRTPAVENAEMGENTFLVDQPVRGQNKKKRVGGSEKQAWGLACLPGRVSHETKTRPAKNTGGRK